MCHFMVVTRVNLRFFYSKNILLRDTIVTCHVALFFLIKIIKINFFIKLTCGTTTT